VIVGLYTGGLDRLADPFALAGGEIVRARKLSHIRPLADGYLYSLMSNARARRLDFWLDEHFYLGALGWHALHRGYAAMPQGAADVRSPEYTATSAIATAASEVRELRARLARTGVGLVVLLMATQNREGGVPAAQRAAVASLLETCRREEIPALDTLAVLEPAAR
jgi:hypothetical protein